MKKYFNFKFVGLFVIASIAVFVLSMFVTDSLVFAKTKLSLDGSYRCWSYNVSGGGSGNCRLFAPIVLKSNGTYSVSSERGTYKVKGSIITLSKSKLRGAGKIIDGNKIRFEYDYNSRHHVVTYLLSS